MLPLGVSNTLCAPTLGASSKKSCDEDRQGPLRCFACGNPSGVDGAGLEWHKAGTKKVRLCPMCHCCVHLDVAGQLAAGRMVWLPEIPQSILNNMALAYFMATRRLESDPENDDLRKYVTSARELFQGIDRRGESIEAVLAHGDKVLMKDERDPRKANLQRQKRRQLSDPSFFAGLILHAKRSANASAAIIAKQIEGVRFVPSIDAFEGYTSLVLEGMPQREGPSSWLSKGRQLADHEVNDSAGRDAQFSGASDDDQRSALSTDPTNAHEPALMG